ncbi:trifunctional transcriptional regulator/proline dehydrogenase/L-glutamate gamma-semialdehyde dehydrogenase [Thorsellia anophelis]|uniref:Bifunctional protein PutA n=1 Tax=Thorsellia anophelis DSM 18579 TaxID=1123402 RepID=A0A1I0C0S5_9GAMM|nr:trifunctional transcriptional regulator/proline dehydrogenase/L-glutamate gamma-semialdehyde dehydrogenase [Thorsellia anophelis]SET12935.1 L-proline dehydrogenase /delta-1-pyrroline-5-carboxylate dehydrogenase [Thorsellia anophelis DSM 18579]
MSNTTSTTGVKLDNETKNHLKTIASALDRTPHWVIKQAIFNYIEAFNHGYVDNLGNLSLESISIHGSNLSDSDIEIIESDMNSSSEKTNLSYQPEQPFLEFAQYIHPQSVLQAAITSAYRRSESDCIVTLIEQAKLSDELQVSAQQLATKLTTTLRNQKTQSGKAGIVQNLLQEFSLSSQEGVALMCLAEALLRIPDKATRDALIRDKISGGDWKAHIGHSPSLFVNAATWGLMLTGKLVSTHNENQLSSSIGKIISKGGEPVIRKAVDMAMRLMGEQFVTGETIDQALANAVKHEAKGFRYSYDMLGEAALTEQDAKAYLASYEQAIHAIGKAADGKGIYEGAGISIKLSALHPRYNRANFDRVMLELYPILKNLVLLAKYYDIGLNIDAEEADRLEISLDLLEKLCFEPELKGWHGIGFVIQAYQKRCPYVIDYLVDLAKRSQRRLMIRLVKGAYWDSEIKRAQLDGLEDYPVYTKKNHTDIAYIACARKLLSEPNYIYPQFATHNAQTLSTIYHLAGNHYYPGQYEFQCLHGMGEPLYEQVVGSSEEGKLNRPCRIYAPVGTHETLLAYLVRRLLENGANTSFVNRIADETIKIETLIESPVAIAQQLAQEEGSLGLPHSKIPVPRHLFGDNRLNSRGFDLSNEHRLASLSSALLKSTQDQIVAYPVLNDTEVFSKSNSHSKSDLNDSHQVLSTIINPANLQDTVGLVQEATIDHVDQAFSIAKNNQMIWSSTPIQKRADILNNTADLMENALPQLLAILSREAGKTYQNGISEVREAIDFLRYYAEFATLHLSQGTTRPLGTVICISPWNFPLAIFTGQIAAALVTGNCVIAKPAEQTPLIAFKAVQLFIEAGLPIGILQLLPGSGEIIGSALTKDDRTDGVIFTGSTQVAKLIQSTLSDRLSKDGKSVPLIAETGGLNAMIVDSSALTEQVVNDVIVSAFDSAGQRCSALRILCLQDDIAEKTLQMLRGAMGQYRIDTPDKLTTDIGPVIDKEAKTIIETHIESMRTHGFKVFQGAFDSTHFSRIWENGHFIVPTLIEINSISDLKQEIFGPVLHVVRYKRNSLANLVEQLNATGYGLTFGVHSRIDETIDKLTTKVNAGNHYVNRNVVGAVVGVQPFGGEGLSGTGPKAGGPLYLYRLLKDKSSDSVYSYFNNLEETISEHVDASRENIVSRTLRDKLIENHYLMINNANQFESILPTFAKLSERYLIESQSGIERTLIGPTGEKNSYLIKPRHSVYTQANSLQDYLTQLLAMTAIGASVIWERNTHTEHLFSMLPKPIQASIHMVEHFKDSLASSVIAPDAILFHGDADILLNLQKVIAQSLQPIIPIVALPAFEDNIPLELFYFERSLSVNTAAAGGNASLMTIG